MGDNGRLYVPEELVPVYRDEVIPLATVLTPNQFEAETLTGMSIQSDEDAVSLSLPHWLFPGLTPSCQATALAGMSMISGKLLCLFCCPSGHLRYNRGDPCEAACVFRMLPAQVPACLFSWTFDIRWVLFAAVKQCFIFHLYSEGARIAWCCFVM